MGTEAFSHNTGSDAPAAYPDPTGQKAGNASHRAGVGSSHGDASRWMQSDGGGPSGLCEVRDRGQGGGASGFLCSASRPFSDLLSPLPLRPPEAPGPAGRFDGLGRTRPRVGTEAKEGAPGERPVPRRCARAVVSLDDHGGSSLLGRGGQERGRRREGARKESSVYSFTPSVCSAGTQVLSELLRGPWEAVSPLWLGWWGRPLGVWSRALFPPCGHPCP